MTSNKNRSIPRAILARHRKYWNGIRAQVKVALKDERGEICGGCGVAQWTDVHHIVPLAAGGLVAEPSNLACLCKACHVAAHHGTEMSEECEE